MILLSRLMRLFMTWKEVYLGRRRHCLRRGFCRRVLAIKGRYLFVGAILRLNVKWLKSENGNGNTLIAIVNSFRIIYAKEQQHRDCEKIFVCAYVSGKR